MKINTKQKSLLFIFTLVVIGYFYNYHVILFHHPYSLHAWRQADCLSLTLNYYKESLNFFTPEVHWIGDKGHGKTISEFPIIYFTVGQLWKVFGQKEFIFRLINILIVFSGLFSLYKLSSMVLRDTFWAFFIPLFLFTSPLLIYYSNNFITNAPALGLALTATYYYYLYDEEKDKKWLVASMTIFTLSGLLKITSLLMFMAVLAVIMLRGIYKILNKKEKIIDLLLKILPFICVLIPIGIWYFYARHYNSQNHQNLFLQNIYPIWELSSLQRNEIANSLYHTLIPSFFNKAGLYGVLIVFITTPFLIKKTDKKYYMVLIALFAGIIAYCLLWFQALDVHDYYLTNLLIFIPAVLLVFLKLLAENYKKVFYSPVLKSILSLLLLFLIAQGALKNRLKYRSTSYTTLKQLFIKEKKQNYWEYIHWEYANNFKSFETIKPYLRSLGIQRNDKIICMSDPSINISLYLMDQKGLTRYGYGNFSDNDRIDFAIQQNCKYLIINENDLKNRDIHTKFTQELIGKYRNIYIYKL